MILSILFMFIVAIVAVIFSWQNPEIVNVNFFGAPIDGPVGLFLLVTLAVGVLLGILLMAPSLISRSFVAARHRRRVAELESMSKEPAAKVSKSQMLPPTESMPMDEPESKPKDPAA